MAQHTTPDGSGPLEDPPPRVQVTVVPGPRRPPVGARIGVVRARVVVGLVVMVVVAAAITITALQAGRPAGSAGAPAEPSAKSRVAAAYIAPLGCLGPTVSTGAPSGVIAHLTRTNSCWRGGAYFTAILQKVHGRWRVMLEAAGPKCPAVSPPGIVRADRVTCERIPRLRHIP